MGKWLRDRFFETASVKSVHGFERFERPALIAQEPCAENGRVYIRNSNAKPKLTARAQKLLVIRKRKNFSTECSVRRCVLPRAIDVERVSQ